MSLYFFWYDTGMAEYIPTGIQNTAKQLREEYERREQQQKRHYYLFNQLQDMARELPVYAWNRHLLEQEGFLYPMTFLAWVLNLYKWKKHKSNYYGFWYKTFEFSKIWTKNSQGSRCRLPMEKI